MKEIERDILAERPQLKEMPYNLPEGYFDGFKVNMKPYRRKRLMPYIAAASVAVLIAAGLFLLRSTYTSDDFTQEDFLVFSSSMTDEAYEYSDELYAEAEVANDDIIEYLIYSGITVEEIEQYKE